MKAGEVWNVDFTPQVGDEIRKVRPAIIVNHNSIGSLKLKIVIPLTDGLRSKKSWHVEINPSRQNGLDKVSMADCFQIKSISESRFVNKRGVLSQFDMEEVKLCMMVVLDLL